MTETLHPAHRRIQQANAIDELTHGFRLVSVDRETFAAAFLEAWGTDSAVQEATSATVAERTGLYRLAYAYGKVVGGYALQVNAGFRLELCHVWGSGYGSRILADAMQHGAEVLDCFDGFLPTFYARFGFVEYAREPNWTPGGPDVVFMAAGELADQIRSARSA